MAVTGYSRTPASNNAAPPNGAPEGWAPSAVNDTIRQIMADIVDEAGKNAAKVLGSVAGTNTITASMTPALDAYSAGMIVILTPANSITGAATLNINSLGALDILKQDGDALASGDMVAGVPHVLALDSGADDWILLNPMSLATLNVSSSLTYGGVEVGYKGLPERTFNASTSTAATDAGGMCLYEGTGGHTFTLDSDLAVTHVVTVVNGGSATLTIAAGGALNWYNGSGTISSGSRSLAVGGVATIRSYGSGTGIIWGTGLS